VALAASLGACGIESSLNDESGDRSAEVPGVKLAASPIAYVGHGALFDRDGSQLALTPELVQGIQELYIDELLASAARDLKDVFTEKQRRVWGGGAWGIRDTLYANAALIDWLLDQTRESAPSEDAERVSGHNVLLRNAVTSEAGIAGAWDAAEYVPPQRLRDQLAAEGVTPTERAFTAQIATSAGGAAYINECRAAGVPIPPSWGTSGWVSRGVLANEFISTELDAEVFSYQSSSPAGVCFALPRSSGNSIRLLGIICLGTASSNACFWDNQRSGGQFFPNKGEVVPFDQFFGGADLQKNIGGMCTDCHAGENPFVIHPGTVLGKPNLNGLPLRSSNWYSPRVRVDWMQNPGPTNILDSVTSSGRCTTCHSQTDAGRFPSVSNVMPGYCGTILPRAFSRTMPPGQVGSAAYQNHYNALIAACQQPPPTVPGRFTAVWGPSNSSEIQLYGSTYASYREQYDQLWGQGWRLYSLQPYVVNGRVLYNAVWRPSTEGEIQVYGWSYTDFRARYDALWGQGWRLKILQPYVLNGNVYYTAVWRPSTEGEIQVYGWSYSSFRAQYDTLWGQGWRLKLLQPYVLNGNVYYTAVWRPSTEGEIQVYGWSYTDFRAQYDALWGQGWRLKFLEPYVLNGTVYYTAAWRPSTEGEFQVYGWNYTDYRARYDTLWNQGWRLKILRSY
jgi:hypothetical protein